jgi:hypothetical protein
MDQRVRVGERLRADAGQARHVLGVSLAEAGVVEQRGRQPRVARLGPRVAGGELVEHRADTLEARASSQKAQRASQRAKRGQRAVAHAPSRIAGGVPAIRIGLANGGDQRFDALGRVGAQVVGERG